MPIMVSHEELCGKNVFGCGLEQDTPRVRFWTTPERDLTPDAFRKVYSSA